MTRPIDFFALESALQQVAGRSLEENACENGRSDLDSTGPAPTA